MKYAADRVLKGAAVMMEHSSVNVSLAGWPAAAAVTAVCSAVTVIAVMAMKTRAVRD